MDDQYNPYFLIQDKASIWMTPEILAELQAEVAERKECISKAFTEKQIEAHIKLWRPEHQPILSKRMTVIEKD